jgi:peptidoglycan L-alanyl-D-glutamate endopeptidase CwlK
MEILRRDRLVGVHPDLCRVLVLAADSAIWPLYVIEGPRTVERQRELFAHGASHTMNSRHIPGPDGWSHAVDVAPAPEGSPSWTWPLYYKLAPLMKEAAIKLGIPIEWGGDWTSFHDGPHWQLPFSKYP